MSVYTGWLLSGISLVVLLLIGWESKSMFLPIKRAKETNLKKWFENDTYIQVFTVFVSYTITVTCQSFIHGYLKLVCTKGTLALFLTQKTVAARTFAEWVTAHGLPAVVCFGHTKRARCSKIEDVFMTHICTTVIIKSSHSLTRLFTRPTLLIVPRKTSNFG